MKIDVTRIHPIACLPFNHTAVNDVGLERLMSSGMIKISGLDESQIQPASLDVTICKARIFDRQAMERIQKWQATHPFQEPPSELGTINLDSKITIPPNCHAEIIIKENIEFDPAEFNLSVELRSSRGRIGLWPYSMLPENEDGELYVPIRNHNPNPLILHTGTPFAQLFFHPYDPKYANGHLVTDATEALEIAGKVFEATPQLIGPYVVLDMGAHALRFKNYLGQIDTSVKHAEDYLYDKLDSSKGVMLETQSSYVCQLEPKMKLPADVGLRILGNAPYSQNLCGSEIILLEPNSANAGWVDPGYEGHVTAHPYRRKFSMKIKRGDPLALGLFVKYDEPSKRAYGSSGLNSHYQKSAGAGSRS